MKILASAIVKEHFFLLRSFLNPPIHVRLGPLPRNLRKLTFSAQSMTESKEATQGTSPPPQQLPKLSSSEFKVYNSMAEHMDFFVPSILL